MCEFPYVSLPSSFFFLYLPLFSGNKILSNVMSHLLVVCRSVVGVSAGDGYPWWVVLDRVTNCGFPGWSLSAAKRSFLDWAGARAVLIVRYKDGYLESSWELYSLRKVIAVCWNTVPEWSHVRRFLMAWDKTPRKQDESLVTLSQFLQQHGTFLGLCFHAPCRYSR